MPPRASTCRRTRTNELLARLLTTVKDPTKGLPEELFLFITQMTPMVNVDLLIQNARHETLLTWRDDGLCPAGWHIPGGIIRYKEPAQNRIRAVAAGELGAEVKFGDKPLAIHEMINQSQRVRGHFIALLYECILTSPPDDRRKYGGTGIPKPGEWAWHRQCPVDIVRAQRVYAKYFGQADVTARTVVYCFDIDGTLCANTEGAYERAEPFPEAIAALNSLYAAGHTILLFTARGSTTGIDWRARTEQQLAAWGVKYHRLLFGKPSADVYIDDKAVNFETWRRQGFALQPPVLRTTKT